LDVIPERFHENARAYVKQYVAGGNYSDVITVVTKEGKERVWEFHNIIEPGEAGSAAHVLAHAADITERIRTETALRASERKFRALFESSKEAVAVVDEEGRIYDYNHTFLDQFGRTAGEQQSILPMWHDSNRRGSMIEELRAFGFVRDFDAKMIAKDGG